MSKDVLLTNQTANGSSGSVTVQGGKATVFVSGANFETATVTIEISPDKTTWVAVTSGAFTSNGYVQLDIQDSTPEEIHFSAAWEVASVFLETDTKISLVKRRMKSCIQTVQFSLCKHVLPQWEL